MLSDSWRRNRFVEADPPLDTSSSDATAELRIAFHLLIEVHLPHQHNCCRPS
jgi:hypothetical protein